MSIGTRKLNSVHCSAVTIVSRHTVIEITGDYILNFCKNQVTRIYQESMSLKRFPDS